MPLKSRGKMTFFPSKTEGIQFILGYSVSDIITRKMNQRNAPPSLFSLPRRPCRTDGLPVHFPYAAIDPEKHVYMGPRLARTGAGKTAALISFITSYSLLPRQPVPPAPHLRHAHRGVCRHRGMGSGKIRPQSVHGLRKIRP